VTSALGVLATLTIASSAQTGQAAMASGTVTGQIEFAGLCQTITVNVPG
jgi:hypothetical protein